MPRCTVIFEDSEEGQVTANISFDPPLNDDEVSPAQSLGARVLEQIVSEAEREEMATAGDYQA